MSIIDQVFQLFRQQGNSMYGGEAVTQTEHALQCAWLAEQEQAASSLVVAALLHDVGHLLHNLGDDCADEGIDDVHQTRGADWLSDWFGRDVVQPVRLHVPAKRYRCAIDPEYLARLSPASLVSLTLQGGPFTGEEAKQFEQFSHAQDSLQLRDWDDLAKVENLQTPDLDHFRHHLEAALTKTP